MIADKYAILDARGAYNSIAVGSSSILGNGVWVGGTSSPSPILWGGGGHCKTHTYTHTDRKLVGNNKNSKKKYPCAYVVYFLRRLRRRSIIALNLNFM